MFCVDRGAKGLRRDASFEQGLREQPSLDFVMCGETSPPTHMHKEHRKPKPEGRSAPGPGEKEFDVFGT